MAVVVVLWWKRFFCLLQKEISQFSSFPLSRYFRGEYKRRRCHCQQSQGIRKFSILSDITVFVAKPQKHSMLDFKFKIIFSVYIFNDERRSQVIQHDQGMEKIESKHEFFLLFSLIFFL